MTVQTKSLKDQVNELSYAYDLAVEVYGHSSRQAIMTFRELREAFYIMIREG